VAAGIGSSRFGSGCSISGLTAASLRATAYANSERSASS
jgi:hypothetical protein